MVARRAEKKAAVSTHSHPKVAGFLCCELSSLNDVSTHSHPKVAGWIHGPRHRTVEVSTHSHPKVAGDETPSEVARREVFQHTATRRWLDLAAKDGDYPKWVSTHSHPKVAGAFQC